MKKLIFQGSYQEIGRILGGIYRQNNKSYNERISKNLFNKQLYYYNKFYPELLEELKGIAEGGDYDFKKVLYASITGEIFWYKNKNRTSCTIFGIKNKFGTFIGRNYDWYPKVTPSIYKYINPYSYDYIAITDNGYGPEPKEEDTTYYIDDAINEKGLYIGITFAHGLKTSYGLSSGHIRKLIIEKCKNVDEALAVFKNIPVACPKNFFIADKKGKMVVVEHASAKNYKVIQPENGILIKTNHYLDSSLIQQDQILLKRPTNSTYLRYYDLLRNIHLMGVKNIKQQQINSLILDKKTYIRQHSENSLTIWSLSLDIKKGKFSLFDKSGKRVNNFL